jgi:hypothetical protein
MSDAKKIISDYMALVEIGKDKNFITPHDAEWRTSQFIIACAKMAEFRFLFTDALIAAESLELMEWNEALKRATGETITARKISAEADELYRNAAAKTKKLRNEIDSFKQFYDVFNNAQFFFKQLATQIHKESRNGL